MGERLIYLLGNHEMPHIYSITLAKGTHLYTPRFEWAMGEHRAEIMALFDSLPFYVRTKAGVTICHAGAAAELGTAQAVELLFDFSHQAVLRVAEEMIGEGKRPSLRRAIAKMNQQPYADIVHKYFGIIRTDDPHYDDFLIGTVASSSHPHFDLLWTALFTQNEDQYGNHAHKTITKAMLRAFSVSYQPQTVLISGHMPCKKGVKRVNNHHLRIASATHAQPRRSGKFLLFDVGKRVKKADDVRPNLASGFS